MSNTAINELITIANERNYDFSKTIKAIKKENSAFCYNLPFKKRFRSEDYNIPHNNEPSIVNVMNIDGDQISKRIKMNMNEINIAIMQKIHIKIDENRQTDYNIVQYNTGQIKYSDMIDHVSTCYDDTCVYCIMPKIKDNPVTCFKLVNHLIGCAKKNCNIRECFAMKNLIKFHMIENEDAQSK
jgi:hypothetical protein